MNCMRATLNFRPKAFLTVKTYHPTIPLYAAHGDFSIGPYPKTPEERERAARKYGMIVEDYEPYPDDGLGVGDYPKLPYIFGPLKDPTYSWNAPWFRDYYEPVHPMWHIVGEHIDMNLKPKIGWFMHNLFSWGSLFGLVFLAWFFQDTIIDWPRGKFELFKGKLEMEMVYIHIKNNIISNIQNFLETEMKKDYPYDYIEKFLVMKTTGEYPTEIRRMIHYSFPLTPQDQNLHH